MLLLFWCLCLAIQAQDPPYFTYSGSTLELNNGQLKRSLSLPKRQAFEEARSSESTMHQLCFSRPETQQLIAENYVSIAE